MISPPSRVLVVLLLGIAVDAHAQCPGPPIACDVPITAGIDVIGETDYLSFDVIDGDIVEITMATVSGSGFAVRWRIVDGDCNPVAGPCGVFQGPARVDCAGLSEASNPHSIEIVDSGNDATGTYTVGLQRLNASTACDGAPLSCDEGIEASLESRVGSDLYSFDVTDTEEIEITVADIGGAGFDPRWRVLDGMGLPIAGPYGSYAVPTRVTCTLSEMGNPYRIEIVDSGRDGIGAYALHFQRLVSAVACDQVPIFCDEAVMDSITSRVESDLYSFDVTGTEEIEIAVADLGGAGFDPRWRVLDGTGLPIAGPCGDYTAPTRITCKLSEAGNPHRIEIVDSGRDEIGAYALHFQRLVAAVACDDTPILCDVAVRDSITSPVESDLYSFVVNDTEVVEVAVADAGGVGFDPRWRILDGQGLPVEGGCGDYTGPTRRTCTLTEAGNPYRIEMADSGRDGTGAYEMHLQRLSVSGATCDDTPIECDVALTDSTASRVESNLYSFDVTGTEEIEITVADLGGAGFDPYWRVLEASGLPFGECGDFAGPSRRSCTLVEAGNPYRIEVADSGRDGVGTFAMHLQRLTAAVACDDVVIACDVARIDSLRSRVESDLFRFEVEGTGDVEITVTDVAGAGFDPWWRVLDGAGRPVPGECGAYGAPRTEACALPDSGNPYRLEMVEIQRDAIGIYEVLVAGCVITSVGTQPGVPRAFRLVIRGPHPPRHGAGVHFLYDVPPPGADLSIDLYDVTGRLVKRMVQGHVPAGSYTGVIAGPRGSRVGAGVYFLRMETPSYRETRSIVLLP